MSGPAGQRLPYLVAKLKAPRIGERLQATAERPLVEHLAQLSWIAEAANVCFFGPPGTGKSHCENAWQRSWTIAARLHRRLPA